jgi:primosomal protein N'
LYLRGVEKYAKKYVEVILPIKFRDTVTYSVPDELNDKIAIGSRVEVKLANKKYKGIVENITFNPQYDIRRIKDIDGIDDFPPVAISQIALWKSVSDYYLCSMGEVLKAASAYMIEPLKRTKKEKNDDSDPSSSSKAQELKPLTTIHQNALDEINYLHKEKKTILLSGASCSGKTEIILHLIKEYTEESKNVLILTPDLSSCKLLEKRLNKISGLKLITYHSKLTEAKRRNAVETIRSHSDGGIVILGLRSSIFLPIENLGLITIFHEHDSSYKQSDPAPRYNGRDTAIMLAKVTGANIILTSSTPSLESLYNVQMGKFSEVHLDTPPIEDTESEIKIIDTKREVRKNAMKGSFSISLIKIIEKGIKENKQIAVFLPKRSFISDEELAIEIGETFHDFAIDIYSDISALESLRVKPTIIALLQAESLFNSQDFRADEKAFQYLNRIYSVLKKGKEKGILIIQTTIPTHPLFKKDSSEIIKSLLEERKEFDLPPYTRMIQISIKDIFKDRLERNAETIRRQITKAGVTNISGPTPPPFEKDEKRHTLFFRIKLKRDKNSEKIKKEIYNNIKGDITIDVDPL